MTIPQAGRNDPCPCGSGRKYKQCCLRKDEDERLAATRVAEPPPAGSLVPTASPGEPTPHRRLLAFGNSAEFARMVRDDPDRAAQYWTSARVAAMETEAIVARLGEVGIKTSRAAFGRLGRQTRSSWDLAHMWQDDLARMLPGRESDLLGIAATELWRRWLPDRPCIEMIEVRLYEGTALATHDRHAEACEAFDEAWRWLRPLLSRWMRTVHAAGVVFPDTTLLVNGLQDYAMACVSAARTSPEPAAAGARFCEEFLDLFPDQDQLSRDNFHCDWGELLFRAGQPERGDQVLRAFIKARPDTAAGYVRLAQMYEDGVAADDGRPDLERALEMLIEARERGVGDGPDFDLALRIGELQGRRPPVAQDQVPRRESD